MSFGDERVGPAVYGIRKCFLNRGLSVDTKLARARSYHQSVLEITG